MTFQCFLLSKYVWLINRSFISDQICSCSSTVRCEQRGVTGFQIGVRAIFSSAMRLWRWRCGRARIYTHLYLLNATLFTRGEILSNTIRISFTVWFCHCETTRTVETVDLAAHWPQSSLLHPYVLKWSITSLVYMPGTARSRGRADPVLSVLALESSLVYLSLFTCGLKTR